MNDRKSYKNLEVESFGGGVFTFEKRMNEDSWTEEGSQDVEVDFRRQLFSHLKARVWSGENQEPRELYVARIEASLGEDPGFGEDGSVSTYIICEFPTGME